MGQTMWKVFCNCYFGGKSKQDKVIGWWCWIFGNEVTQSRDWGKDLERLKKLARPGKSFPSWQTHKVNGKINVLCLWFGEVQFRPLLSHKLGEVLNLFLIGVCTV